MTCMLYPCRHTRAPWAQVQPPHSWCSPPSATWSQCVCMQSWQARKQGMLTGFQTHSEVSRGGEIRCQTALLETRLDMSSITNHLGIWEMQIKLKGDNTSHHYLVLRQPTITQILSEKPWCRNKYDQTEWVLRLMGFLPIQINSQHLLIVALLT